MMQAARTEKIEGSEAPMPVGRLPRLEFDALYESRYVAMARLAYFLTGSASHAEEATQDAFVKVLEHWRRIDDPVAYLRVAVVNRCRSAHRARVAAARRESWFARGAGHVDHPDEITDALARLTRRRREVVVLRFYEDLSLGQIATLLGVTEGTVKATLHHALADLRGALQ